MILTRRAILASTALAVTPIGGSTFAQTPSAGPSMNATQAPGFYRYKIGDIEVTAINDGYAKRPLEGFIKNADLAQVQEAMKAASCLLMPCRSRSTRSCSGITAG
jgi:hypothetical protein